jgi:hypothetical protein
MRFIMNKNRPGRGRIIPPEQRGQKPTVSGDPNDPTVSYTIRIPLSLKNFLLKIGPENLRKMLKREKLRYG